MEMCCGLPMKQYPLHPMYIPHLRFIRHSYSPQVIPEHVSLRVDNPTARVDVFMFTNNVKTFCIAALWGSRHAFYLPVDAWPTYFPVTFYSGIL
jgi:hypothetical protein